MNRFLILAAAIMMVTPGCGKDEKAGGTPVMKKVESRGAKGLPAAEKAPEDKVQVRAAMGGKAGDGMPDDDVHRKARGKSAMPPGHPETGHGADMVTGPTDGNPIPLKKTGLGSADELASALARVKGEAQKKLFERGFRLTFSVDRSKRDVDEARAAFEKVLKDQPDSAESHRGLAYVALSDGFDIKACEAHYLKALELRPDYGEVHYALAFLYLGSDRVKGAEHLKKAMDLKIPDEQGLKKIYSGK